MDMTNQCIICGAEIPEGKQVCTGCEIKSNANLEADLKAAHEEIGRLRAKIKKFELSDASKENSSIEYYNLYRKLKEENRELKYELKNAQVGYELERERRQHFESELSKMPYCTEGCKLCNLGVENAELKARLERITAIGNNDDESGSGGLWDLAAKISSTVASIKEAEMPFYSMEWGQEQIYNILCDWLKELNGDKQ